MIHFIPRQMRLISMLSNISPAAVVVRHKIIYLYIHIYIYIYILIYTSSYSIRLGNELWILHFILILLNNAYLFSSIFLWFTLRSCQYFMQYGIKRCEDWQIGKDCEGSNNGLTGVLPRLLSGWTEKKLGENYDSCGMKSTDTKSRIMITFVYALKTLL